MVPEEAAVAEAVAEPSAAVPAAMESEAAAVDESAPAAEPVAAESVAQVDPAGDTAVAEVPAVADASAAGPTDMEAENSVPAGVWRCVDDGFGWFGGWLRSNNNQCCWLQHCSLISCLVA